MALEAEAEKGKGKGKLRMSPARAPTSSSHPTIRLCLRVQPGPWARLTCGCKSRFKKKKVTTYLELLGPLNHALKVVTLFFFLKYIFFFFTTFERVYFASKEPHRKLGPESLLVAFEKGGGRHSFLLRLLPSTKRGFVPDSSESFPRSG